jgi:hypothetical protein
VVVCDSRATVGLKARQAGWLRRPNEKGGCGPANFSRVG